MPTLDVYSLDKKKVGTVDLSDDVFGAKVNVPLVHQVIKAQLAGRRQGTASTKTRAEVRGARKKPFRQKGTGNARQGQASSPLQVGGGQSFGPKPRSYDQATPKEMMRGALRSVISDRVKENRVLIVDDLKFDEPRTKRFVEVFRGKFDLNKALVVDDENRGLELSGRNVPLMKVLRTEGLNAYDVVDHEWLVLSKRAAEAVNQRLAPRSAKAGAQ